LFSVKQHDLDFYSDILILYNIICLHLDTLSRSVYYQYIIGSCYSTGSGLLVLDAIQPVSHVAKLIRKFSAILS